MIIVFISYSNKSDKENANKLCDYLNNEKIKSILAPRDEETAIEIAEMIANEIDSCNFFITFYTTEGKDNRWVNQELGYAFNHIRQNGLKIIPIYDDRDDFKEFLSSKSYNFYQGFKLNRERPEETMEKIKNYLMDNYKHPITLEFEIRNNDRSPVYTQPMTTLEAIISIHNNLSKKIQDAYLDFVFHDYKPGSFRFESGDPEFEGVSEFIKTKYVSTILPKIHSDKITVFSDKNNNNKNINRHNFLLQDILGCNVYEIPLTITISNDLPYISFAVYLTIPLYGTTYYKAILQNQGKKWICQCFNPSDEQKDSIAIQ